MLVGGAHGFIELLLLLLVYLFAFALEPAFSLISTSCAGSGFAAHHRVAPPSAKAKMNRGVVSLAAHRRNVRHRSCRPQSQQSSAPPKFATAFTIFAPPARIMPLHSASLPDHEPVHIVEKKSAECDSDCNREINRAAFLRRLGNKSRPPNSMRFLV